LTEALRIVDLGPLRKKVPQKTYEVEIIIEQKPNKGREIVGPKDGTPGAPQKKIWKLCSGRTNVKTLIRDHSATKTTPGGLED